MATVATPSSSVLGKRPRTEGTPLSKELKQEYYRKCPRKYLIAMIHSHRLSDILQMVREITDAVTIESLMSPVSPARRELLALLRFYINPRKNANVLTIPRYPYPSIQELVAALLMHEWLKVEDVGWHAALSALFHPTASTGFFGWLHEYVLLDEADELPFVKDLTFQGLTVVQWAYRLNNLDVLKWCWGAHRVHQEGARLFPTECWKPFALSDADLKKISPEVREWWAQRQVLLAFEDLETQEEIDQEADAMDAKFNTKLQKESDDEKDALAALEAAECLKSAM